MRIPKIGEEFLAFQFDDERPGELEFCCSTQCNLVSTMEQLEEEIQGVIDEPDCEDCDTGELINSRFEDGDVEPIIYKVIRIR